MTLNRRRPQPAELLAAENEFLRQRVASLADRADAAIEAWAEVSDGLGPLDDAMCDLADELDRPPVLLLPPQKAMTI